MEFCKICKNMLYMKLSTDPGEAAAAAAAAASDDPQLSYYCRKCGHEEDAGVQGTSCAYRVVFKQNDAATLQPLNAFTKFDPTLPVAPQTPCPTEGCTVADSVRYIRYDNVNIKFIYLCTACDATWTVANTASV